METLNSDTFRATVPVGSLTDQPLCRCPDVLAFHAALDRVFPEKYDFAGERHPFYELVCAVDGPIGITAEEEVCTLNAGQILLHTPDEFHRIRSEGGTQTRVLNLSFHAAAMPDCDGRILSPGESEIRELLRIVGSVGKALENSNAGILNEERTRFELWLTRVMRGGGEKLRTDSYAALRYAEIVNFLHSHVSEPLDAAQIAKGCNVSLSSLKKIFSAYAGMGVSRFFTEMKIRRASDLLRRGERVGDVAEALGYPDRNYFSTVFRRVTGKSPTDLKKPTENSNLRSEYRKESKNMKFITVENYNQLSRQAANLISAQVIMKPDSVLGLATGSSPVGVYRQLIDWYRKGDIDFSEVTSINLDEYVGLTPDDPQSYRYFMQTNFFDHVNIKRENTFVPDGCAADPVRECAEYDERIERFGGIDLQLLGIGIDGHIGFNEPSDVFIKATHVVDLHESTLRANARFFATEADVPRQAISMGMVSIMQAKKIVLIANGPAKKEILYKAFYGPITPMIPASILQLHPDITVIFSET